MSKKWSDSNKDKVAAKSLKWKNSNREKWREAKRKWMKNRRQKATPIDKLHHNVRSKVWEQLKKGKNRRSTFVLLGYTSDELKLNLEKRFKSGMSWDNYGEWHIDHIVPRAAFNITCAEDFDFKRCWALDNLQPLWKTDNFYKSNKLIIPWVTQ